METATVILVLVAALVLAVIINLMFTMYHLYLRSNYNYQHRLLNILFSHLAASLQLGSIINVLNIVRSLGLDTSSIKNVNLNQYFSPFSLPLNKMSFILSMMKFSFSL